MDTNSLPYYVIETAIVLLTTILEVGLDITIVYNNDKKKSWDLLICYLSNYISQATTT